ncbi:MAG: D-alanyl-D-alanine carboxypeptidase/D-alanyl-D-alanine-endopeptidase [Dysgonomonas sp.]
MISLSTAVFSQQKNNAIDTFIKTKGLENSSIGICVKDESNKILYEYNRSKSFTPASILKILTTATALETFGPEYRFKTELFVDTVTQNTLVIRGYGDPTLGSEYMKKGVTDFLSAWLSAIKKNLQQPINIIVDDSRFGYDGVSRKWMREDMGNYYAAGSYGISIFDNLYRLSFNTNGVDSLSEPLIVTTLPEMRNIRFTNNLTVNDRGEDNGYIVGEPFSNDRLLIGNIPNGRAAFSIKGDIPDPGLYLGQTLSQYLTDNGIEIKSVQTVRTLYSGWDKFLKQKLIYTELSPPLQDVVRVVNERSNNHYAEHLIRQIGMHDKESDDQNALSDGIEDVKTYWQQKGLDSQALFMYDGCGLAPSNAVSPEFMCDVLFYMQNKSTNSAAFMASLPKAGIEGTVVNFMKGTRLDGKLLLKSGSIANVQCYAGYYVVKDKKYSFVVMVNNFNGERRSVVKAIEKLFLTIF